MDKNLGQRVLERAVEKFGEERVAMRLELSPSVLRLYLHGEKHFPEALLLRVVDLVLDGGDDLRNS